MSLELAVASSEVPENLECVISNEKWQELIALLLVTVPDGSKINIGPGPIAAADRIWPWLRLEADGRPDTLVGGQLYHYVGGFWLATHPGRGVIMYEGVEADIPTYDGGETGAITATTGAFWEKVAQMNGRIPIGPGNLVTSGDAIAINTDYGKDEVQLGDENYRHHKHFVVARQSVSGGSAPSTTNQVADDGGGFAQENYMLQGTGSAASRGLSSNVNGDTAANEEFSIVPPVRGMFFIRRTTRIYVRR
jgi:microcystin-dependent protein